MNSSHACRHTMAAFCFLIVTIGVADAAFGQVRSATVASGTTLVVEGRVVNVFRSASSNKKFLIQVLVQQSEAIRLEEMTTATRFPAPGEYLYVHVDTSAANAIRDRRETSVLPRPNMHIRAMLKSGVHQQWNGVSQAWYREIEKDSAMRDSNRGRSLGVTAEVALLGGQAVLKVVDVAGGSPAQRAGIEPGMLILTADGKPLAKPENLVKAEREAQGVLLLKLFEPKSRDERTVRVDLR